MSAPKNCPECGARIFGQKCDNCGAFVRLEAYGYKVTKAPGGGYLLEEHGGFCDCEVLMNALGPIAPDTTMPMVWVTYVRPQP